jgi:predicted DNA-binding ribbon-helix-helix protein
VAKSDEPLVSRGVLRLTAAEWDGLDAMAEKREISRATLLRKMVQRFLAGEAAKAARENVTPHFKGGRQP